jgi:thioredoxin reductase
MMNERKLSFDVVVIGGGFAGVSAVMPLVRARRRVLLVDGAKPRNRFTRASHGFLGLDGVSPIEIRATALAQLARYPGFSIIEREVMSARQEEKAFRLTLDDGRIVMAIKLILACGVTDTLPEIRGLRERWGRSVFHCPYCDGYEINQAPIGILSPTELGLHQALMLPDWGPTTLFTHGTFQPSEADLAKLAARNVTIEPVAVTELLGTGEKLEALRLADGRTIPVAGLFVQPKTRVASEIPVSLGLDFAEGMTGPYIRLVEGAQTSVDGIFAAGDAASQMHNATMASASGFMAGVSSHRALIHDHL